MLIDRNVPNCPHCKSPAIGLPRSYPPEICCTGCPARMTGQSYHEVLTAWSRRDGIAVDELQCTKCRKQSSTFYDTEGAECLCGGTWVKRMFARKGA